MQLDQLAITQVNSDLFHYKHVLKQMDDVNKCSRCYNIIALIV